MLLSDLIDGYNLPGVEVSDLAFDSRRAGPGSLFFCVSGFQQDGHDFAKAAVAGGAVALVTERPLGLGVTEVVVDSVRSTMADVAARFYGDPSATLEVVAITGTNGKTTTAFLLHAILEAAGRSCGLLGTVKSLIGGVQREASLTTDEAIGLQADFAAMLAAGNVCCVMEASSHALELHRCDSINLSAAIFTNLTQDHLDFHATMEGYFLAKRRLWELAPAVALANVDNPYGRRLADEFPQTVTFALDAEADFRATDIQTDLQGSGFTVTKPDGVRLELRSPLPGRFNVANVLASVATASSLGVSDETITKALTETGQVRGRLEVVDEGQDFTVLVDYAHTPDALESVLVAVREITSRRLILALTGEGDRDRTKRPIMGEIASRLADVVVVTSDNPRSEDPQAIVDEVMVGTGPNTEAIADRREAIKAVINAASPGDVVVIAGRGHEQWQKLADGAKVIFDDVTVARETLVARVGNKEGRS